MKHSKSSLFLMEIIIAILFFSLASTVCIQLFVKSHLLSTQTVNQNHAVVSAQNLAELFLATEGDLSQFESLYPACEFTTGSDVNSADTSAVDTSTVNSSTVDGGSVDTVMVYFNNSWTECTASQSRYTAQLVLLPEENGLIAADIQVIDTESPDAPIYALHVTHHIPERSGNHE